MIFPIGATSQSIDILVTDDTGLPVTGLLAATFPTVTLSKAGPNANITLTLVDLALITTVWTGTTDCGVKERSGGRYRLDLLDSVFSSGGIWNLWGEATNKRIICPPIEVSKLMSLVEADLYIDTSVVPWAEVHMLKGTGGIGVGTELLRRRLFSIGAESLVSVNTVVGQAKQ